MIGHWKIALVSGGHVGSSHVKLSGCDYSEKGRLSSVEGSWPATSNQLIIEAAAWFSVLKVRLVLFYYFGSHYGMYSGSESLSPEKGKSQMEEESAHAGR